MSEIKPRIIRVRELCLLVGLSRSTIYELINPGSLYYNPQFPLPRKLGSPRAVGWYEPEVNTWLKNLACVRAA